MRHRSLLTATCWLTLGSTLVFHAAGAAPRADTQDRFPNATNTTRHSEETKNTAVWSSQSDARAGARTPLQNPRQPVRIPCLRGVFNEGSSEGQVGRSECAEPSEEQGNFSIQFDRHIGTRSGILDDIDGVRVDYRLTGGLNLNGVAGYPVLSAEDKFNTNRRLFGISADVGKFARSWDFNSYLIEQHDNAGPTSRAVGGALRHVQTKRSVLFYTDYDLSEKSLNAFIASGVWLLAYDTRIIATLDVQNSPIQKRQKKYLQESTVTATGWKWPLPSEQILQLTKHGARAVNTLGLGLSHAFSPRLTLSGDIALIDPANDADADGRPFHESFEYFSHLKLSAKDLMVPGDSNVFDLRHSVSDASQISSARIHSRYEINPYWTINPRFSADYGSMRNDNSESWISSSAVKMEYRWKGKGALEFELGGKWLNQETPDLEQDYATYFLAFGYQTKF